MEIVRLQPIAGALVRDPVSLVPLPRDGADVELTSYWRARLADGSVKRVEPPAAATAKAEPPAAVAPTLQNPEQSLRRSTHTRGPRES